MLSRRHFISTSLATSLPSPVVRLRDLAAARGIRFGSEITCADIADPDYRNLVAGECAIVTPGLEAKWAAIEPEENQFSFGPLDHIAGFARQSGLALHMHNMIWSLGLPDWTIRGLADGRGNAIMQRHISAAAQRYRGMVDSWDVVNEPLDPRWPSAPEGLCTTPWRRFLGAAYVEKALQAASDADPNARLLVNDDDLEYDLPDREKKRSTYLRLIEGWLRSGVKLHGFGLEAHLKPWLPFAAAPYRRFLRSLGGFGLKLYITELDVCDRTLPAAIAPRDRIVADCVRNYLSVALDEPAICTVIVWGLSDRTTYMNADFSTRRPDGLAARPCAFDAHLVPKPLYHALAGAFRAAPDRI